MNIFFNKNWSKQQNMDYKIQSFTGSLKLIAKYVILLKLFMIIKLHFWNINEVMSFNFSNSTRNKR